MFVKHIAIGKYRHIENINLGPFLRPGDASELVVLAGPNGGGKSSVLELISLALSSMWSLTYSMNRSQPTSSFELTIGLLPHELDLIRDHRELANQPRSADARAYLLANHTYCRSFQFQGGEYAKNPTLHNTMHEIVQSVLRGSFSRPLGFHLGADRSYQKIGFQRENLFNYSAYTTFNHTWRYAFDTTSAQYKDMFDFLVTWRYHFTRRVGNYHLQYGSNATRTTTLSEPVDEYGMILSKLFPGYQFIDNDEDAPTDLFVRIPTGEVIAFSDLSSGEKEVFFTLCFFQRHEVEEAVIIIDEPELHLHPSLARLLIRTMLELKPRNQIWLATQNSEVVDEAGRDRVLFIRKNEDSKRAEVIRATDEEEALLCLRDLFGQAGYIGLARAMIFTESRNSSADRKMFSKLFPHSTRDIKIIPVNGCSEIERVNRAVLSILQSNLGWCRFFLIRDRDYMTADAIGKARARAGDNLFVLPRHEIENYLLDFDVISKVLGEIFSVERSAAAVEADLVECARAIAGEVLRDMLAFRLNYEFRPEDFSIPRLMQGELAFAHNDGWPEARLGQLQNDLMNRAKIVVDDMGRRVSEHNFESLFVNCREEVERAVQSRDWMDLFPGKELLQAFCIKHGIGKAPVFQNALIKELAAHREKIPHDLASIIGAVTI